MVQQTRNCQNCKKDFIIEPEDFDFYKKINVPPPTWCPDCRMVRRMMFRNERSWYRRKSDATSQSILAMFSSDKPYKVYEQDYWKSDKWDPTSYGRDYNFLEPFFRQFKKLLIEVPHPNLVQKNNVNSEYTNYTLDMKNCYFCASGIKDEDGAYLFGRVTRTKNCLDLYQVQNSEACYELVDCTKSNHLLYSQNCEGCLDSLLLYDCRNCTNCVGCVGLRNKQYHIFNKQYDRETYFKEFEKLNLGDREGLARAIEKFEALKLSIPRKYAAIIKSEHVVGDDIASAKNCFYCFMARQNVENCKYSFVAFNSVKDGQDATLAFDGAEVFYEIMSVNGQRVICSGIIWGGYDIQYSYNCFDCNNIFGCVNLKNKSYCILNKQYTKEEYNVVFPRIIKHMNEMPYKDGKGRVYSYGEFFPPELSPFAYNETIAQEYYPLTKEEAEDRGYAWKDPEAKQYQITKTPDQLPDHIKDVNDSILGDIIGCAHKGECHQQCSTAFKLISQELQFYRQMNIPPPQLCPNCRHYERLNKKNPLKLWSGQCQCAGVKSQNGTYQNTVSHQHRSNPCPQEFQTPYSPDRKEIIYCQECYILEIS